MDDPRRVGADVRASRNTFGGFALDRAATARPDPAAIERHWSDRGSCLIPVLGTEHPFVDGDPPRPLLVDAAEVDRARAETIFLGIDGEQRAWFAWLLDEGDATVLKDPVTPVALRQAATQLPESEAALLAYAGAMAFWHRRHRFCGSCGAPTRNLEAGFLRECERCAERQFPRCDPAVIVLAVHGPPGSPGERCLLGRQPRWPAGMYSTIAGFVEPGESVEQCVVREVAEETGIHVAALDYRSSQPWPFPSSLMLGFHARALDDEIVVDRTELEDARWFTRAEVEAARAGEADWRMPSRISIARRLIEEWLDRGA